MNSNSIMYILHSFRELLMMAAEENIPELMSVLCLGTRGETEDDPMVMAREGTGDMMTEVHPE